VQITQETTILSILAGGFLFSLILVAFWMDDVSREILVHEDGIVEWMSAAGYILCAFYFVYRGGARALKQYPYIVLTFILLFLRELDFHNRFTTMSILKTKFFVSGEVSIPEKVAGTLAIALLVYVAVMLLVRHLKSFWIALRKRSPTAFAALLAFLLMGASKSLDGIGKKLGALGISMTERSNIVTEVTEEIMELGIPMALLIALHAHYRKSREEETGSALPPPANTAP
jgi:hypothetical protein